MLRPLPGRAAPSPPLRCSARCPDAPPWLDAPLTPGRGAPLHLPSPPYFPPSTARNMVLISPQLTRSTGVVPHPTGNDPIRPHSGFEGAHGESA